MNIDDKIKQMEAAIQKKRDNLDPDSPMQVSALRLAELSLQFIKYLTSIVN